ncbi:beta-hydroxylase, aspartyl/asparaginyl domain protein [Bordetella bronchiseptica M435/02/3]|nr:beta-hydroxylase, aspartyl/asparaginyl domain protein [Bordetella bronchiseptica M435/02/3]
MEDLRVRGVWDALGLQPGTLSPDRAGPAAHFRIAHGVLVSILEPGTRIPLQRGPYNGVLRLHLALIVPQMPGSAGAKDQNRATSVRRLPRPRPWALD